MGRGRSRGRSAGWASAADRRGRLGLIRLLIDDWVVGDDEKEGRKEAVMSLCTNSAPSFCTPQ